jgi:hypothetical protein
MQTPTARSLVLTTLALALLMALPGCVEESAVKPDMGPATYDALGTMPCSAGAATFDQACGWRVLRKPGGGAEIWVSNIAVRDRPAHRVLSFAQGEFTARDGGPLQDGRRRKRPRVDAAHAATGGLGRRWLAAVPPTGIAGFQPARRRLRRHEGAGAAG